jgi:hypothetical protein
MLDYHREHISLFNLIKSTSSNFIGQSHEYCFSRTFKAREELAPLIMRTIRAFMCRFI